MSALRRRISCQVAVGEVRLGGGAPIVVQSMTNTDTADAAATARQVDALWRAGSELVRITVNTPEAAAQVAPIRERRVEYEKNPRRVLEMLDAGSKRARVEAVKTMTRVREAVFGWEKKRKEISSGGTAANAD